MLTVELRSIDATLPLLRLDGDPRAVAEVVAGFTDGPAISAPASGRVFFATTPGFGSAGRSLDDPEESLALRDLLAAALAGAETFHPLVMFSDVDRPCTHFDRLTVWDDDVASDFRLADAFTAAGTSEGAIKAWQTRQSAGPHHEGYLDLAHRGRRTAAQAKVERDRLAKLLAENPEKDRGRAKELGSIDAAGDASTLARHDRIHGNQWSRERKALHKRILDAEFAAAADVPNDRQAVLLGGLPGSGKSRLGEHPDLGLDPGRYLYIDPDHFKEVLLDTPGAVDRVDGMSAGEHAALVHKESTYLVDLMIARAMKQGKNVIIDRTMSLSPRPEMKELTDHGYRVRGVFADITVNEAVESADERWKHGSGRFVPEPFILDAKTPDARSKNLLKFQEAAADMDDWAIVDQTGIAKRTPLGKVRRGSGTAAFAAGVTVFRALDYQAVTGLDHPGTAADQAATLDAGDRVNITGACACALLNELAGRVEPVDLTLLTIDGRRNIFGDVKANQLRRVDMPQIPPDKLDDFAAHLRSVGVGVRHTDLDPLELRATQNELDGRKVGQMVQATQLGTMDAPPVWVSADGYVLDGTHRWAAEAVLASDTPRKMAVCQASCPMSTLIVMARAFADGAGIDSKAHGMRLRPVAFAGTSDGARKAWESRQRAKHPQPAAAPAAPKPQADVSGLDAQIADGLAKINPVLAKLRDLNDLFNKDSFYRQSPYSQTQAHQQEADLKQQIKPTVDALNAAANERMDASYEELPPADYDKARWDDVPLEAATVPHPHGGMMTDFTPKLDHPEFGEAAIQANYDDLYAERLKKSGPFHEPKPDAPAWMSKKTVAEQQAELRAEAARLTAEYGSPKFARARDRWVVADTPTLELGRALRGEIPMTPGLKRRASEAKMLTSGTLNADTKLSRSMELPPAVASGLRPGAVFESKNYMATQFGAVSPYDRASDAPGTIHTVATILAPKGTHAGDVSYGETILRPGRMRVIDAVWDGTTHRVTLEYLNEL